MGCTSLESINFNKGLIDIGARAFKDCALTSLDLPSSTDEIGVNAFKGCTKIEKIVERATEHPDISGRDVFEDVDISQIELFVPYGAQDDYMYADVWQEFYTIDEYETEVTVVSEDDSKGTVSGSGIYEKGSTAKIEAEPAEGYVFAGWDDGQANPFDAKRTITVGETPETFTASFEPRQLYIQFKDWDGTILHTAKVPYGGSVETESFEPTRKGYSFTGWSMAPAGLTDDEEITATYAINSYELTINAEHGVVTAHTIAEEEVNLKAILYGTVIVLDVKTDENYHFKQWENGSETMYRIFTIEDDKTVTATFEHDPYTVTFVDKDGKTLKTEQVAMGGSATAPDAPEVEGYHFTGWDPADLSKVTEDLTVKATYAINTYTVKFYDHSDNVISTQTVNWNEAAVEPELADWEGHTFTSWSVEFDHVKSDLDIKPIYDVETYKVTFVGFDGETSLKVENVQYGQGATAPEAPAVEGYTFTGWDKAFDNITGDLTVKAVYERNYYKLTLVAEHGSIAITDESAEHSLNPDNIEHGTKVRLAATPDEGYQFKEWSTGEKTDVIFITVTANKTVTATFEEEPDLTPQNLNAELTEKDGDTEITLSWDKVAGVPSYEVKLTVGEKELGVKNTFGRNTVTELLSAIVKEYSIKPGTYLVSWAVRSTDIMGTAVSDWAEGIAFQITVKDTGTGIDQVPSDNVQCTKVLINGTLYIKHNGKTYNAAGQLVR